MKSKFLFTVILTSLCLLLFIVKTFAQEGYKTENFKVNKNGSLKIESSGGDIKVNTWERNEVKIIYENDDDYNNTIIKQNGNDVTIISRDYIDFEVTIPSEFNLSLNTSGGDIYVKNNIKGNVKINTSGGDINVMDVAGEVSVTTSGGDIKSGNVKGNAVLSSSGGDISVGSVEGECKLSTGGGNVQVSNVTKALVVATGGGNVQSGNVASDLNIVTGGGNISVDKISGEMTITTGGGNVSAKGLSKGGKISTGSGNISLKNLSDGVGINTGAGNITAEFISVSGKKSNIISGYGNITLYIPDNANVTIEAIVKFTEGNTWTIDKKKFSEVIKSEFPASTEDQSKGEYKAVYKVNGGGTPIYLQTSIGSIEIKKLKR